MALSTCVSGLEVREEGAVLNVKVARRKEKVLKAYERWTLSVSSFTSLQKKSRFQSLNHIAGSESAVWCAEMHGGALQCFKTKGWNETITRFCFLICLIYSGLYFVLSERRDTVYVGLWPGQLVWCMVVSVLCVFSRRNKSSCHSSLLLSVHFWILPLSSSMTAKCQVAPCFSSCTDFE